MASKPELNQIMNVIIQCSNIFVISIYLTDPPLCTTKCAVAKSSPRVPCLSGINFCICASVPFLRLFHHFLIADGDRSTGCCIISTSSEFRLLDSNSLNPLWKESVRSLYGVRHWSFFLSRSIWLLMLANFGFSRSF